MRLNEYIKENITTKEGLPFQTTTSVFQKGEQAIKIGDEVTDIFFVVSGIVETVMIAKGEEKIVDFYFPNYFLSPLTSYLNKEGSDININCIVNTVVERIPIKELLKTQNTSRLSSQLIIHMLSQNFALRVKKEKDFLTKNAEERYKEILKTRPEIIQQIPNSRIAKYLGIHPSSLSRLKSSLSKE